MTLTAYVAQLLGVYLVLSGVLMIVREQAMMLLVPKFVDTPPFLYFLGSLRVLIGLAIVLAHNMWIGTLGTVICWLAHDSAWYCHARASRRNGAENSNGLFTWQRLVHNSDRRDRAWRLARLRRIHRVISWRGPCDFTARCRERCSTKPSAPSPITTSSSSAGMVSLARYPPNVQIISLIASSLDCSRPSLGRAHP